MKINHDGKEIEVFTSEEVEAKTKEAATQAAESAKTEAIEAYKKENPDLSSELTDLKTKLTEAEKLLKEKGGDDDDEDSKDPQVQRLRQERDDAKKALEDFQTDVEKKIDEKLGALAGETKDEWLEKLSGGDVELRKKIEFEFDNYRTGANSKKDIAERMEKAVQLATGEKAEPGIFDFGGTGGGDRGTHEGSDPDTEEYNDNERSIGRVLGVTEDDKKNYSEFQKKQAELEKVGLIPPGQVRKPKK